MYDVLCWLSFKAFKECFDVNYDGRMFETGEGDLRLLFTRGARTLLEHPKVARAGSSRSSWIFKPAHDLLRQELQSFFRCMVRRRHSNKP